jgi:hypothetical protein
MIQGTIYPTVCRLSVWGMSLGVWVFVRDGGVSWSSSTQRRCLGEWTTWHNMHEHLGHKVDCRCIFEEVLLFPPAFGWPLSNNIGTLCADTSSPILPNIIQLRRIHEHIDEDECAPHTQTYHVVGIFGYSSLLILRSSKTESSPGHSSAFDLAKQKQMTVCLPWRCSTRSSSSCSSWSISS